MYSGEFTIELINRGRYQCEYCGTQRNITHKVFAGDKKTETKIFLDYIRAAWRAEEKKRQKQTKTGGKEKC